MADLDDLLGDGGAPPAADDDDLLGGGGGGGGDDMDDLLGGTSSASPAFDDDLLGGGPAPQQAASASSRNAEPSPPPQPEVPRQRAHAFAIPMLGGDQVSPAVKVYMSAVTFFARYVNIIDEEGRRKRRVVTVTDQKVYVLNEAAKADRDIPIPTIVGIVTQNVKVTKMLVMREDELHVLLQIQGDKDLLFALTKDEANGDTSKQQDIVAVITDLTRTYSRDAVPCRALELTENERIDEHCKWKSGIDDRSLRALTLLSARRCTLLKQHDALNKEEAQYETTLASLKTSSAAQALSDVTHEINELGSSIQAVQSKVARLNTNKSSIENSISAVHQELKVEEARRAEAVNQNVQKVGQDALVRQVAEYELMKIAHKREIDKISSLTTIYERRSKDRRSDTVTAAGLGLRLDDLEDLLAMVTEKLNEKVQHQAVLVKQLAEKKRRLAHMKDLVGTMTEQMQGLKALPLGSQLPPELSNPIVIPPLDASEKLVGDDQESPAETGAPLPAAAQPPAAGPITDSPELLPAKPPAAAPVVLSDSPDLPPPMPPPAKPAAINLDDDI